MQPEDITLEDIFDAGIERLQRHGWTQDNMGTVHGPNCAVGALWYGVMDLLGRRSAYSLGPGVISKYEQTVAMLSERVDRDACIDDVTVWNDQPERSVEDVLLLFKEVRTELEAEL